MSKIILSRKGYDDQYGGKPSPILPDGTMLSFPIPIPLSDLKEEGLHSHELTFKGMSLEKYFEELGHKETNRIVTYGREGYSQYQYAMFAGNTVSRLHFVIINQTSNVWLYDLNSYEGVFVDGIKVIKKQFLHGLHTLRFGNYEIKVKTSNKILV